MGDFATLSTALTGLHAHRRAIESIGHNVANVNTEGFTRRRVELAPAGGAQVGGIFARDDRVGAGVDVAGVIRLRDELLDLRARREMGGEAFAQRTAQIMTQVERTMPEPSEQGIAAQLAAFWGAWDDAAARPGDLPIRAALLARAEVLIGGFHTVAASLTDLHDGLLRDLRISIAQVNADAARVAELNGAIAAAIASKADPNDLADQRDLIVDRLVTTLGATTRSGEAGAVDVYLGGTALVRANRAEAIRLEVGGSLPSPLDGNGFPRVEVRWASDGYPVNGLGGSMAATRDGLNLLVPRALHQVDTVVANLVQGVNTLHQAGQGLDPVGDLNLSFFDPAATTARTVSLSADVAGQPSRIALAPAGAGLLDGSLGHRIAALSTAADGPDAAYRDLIGRLAVEVQSLSTRADVQRRIAQQAVEERAAMTGVSLDEEMAALVAAQRAYEASSRVLTTVDEMLDVLINRTGVVGR